MADKIIYFLCTGNSARSQMAEGFAKKYLSGEYDIYSGGIEITAIHPNAIAVMNEIGIDISTQTSDLVDIKLMSRADLVVTLCKDAYERCPVVPQRSQHIHWGLDDPATAKGTPEEKLEIFRKTRDEIEALIKQFSERGIQDETRYIDKEAAFHTKKENFGEILKQIREEQGKSLNEFAEILGINEDFLRRAEADLAEPSKYFIHRLALRTKQDYDTVLERLYIVKK